MLVLAWLACLVATLLIAFWKVQSVAVTGPLIFLLGLGTIFAGIRVRHAATWLLGMSHCAVCLLLTVLVNIFRWNAAEAIAPFTVIGLIYVAQTLPLTVLTYYHMPAVRPH